MSWKEELREIVDNARLVPTFEEWFRTTGYREMPETVAGPLQMRSVLRTLYLRYLKVFRKAA